MSPCCSESLAVTANVGYSSCKFHMCLRFGLTSALSLSQSGFSKFFFLTLVLAQSLSWDGVTLRIVPETCVVNHCAHLVTTKWQELPLSPCYPHRAYTGRRNRTLCIVSDGPWENCWLPGLWMLIALVSVSDTYRTKEDGSLKKTVCARETETDIECVCLRFLYKYKTHRFLNWEK